LLVERNGVIAPRSIVSVDSSAQSVTWSGSVRDGEEAHLGVLSSEAMQNSIQEAVTHIKSVPHEGGFVFSDQARYDLI